MSLRWSFVARILFLCIICAIQASIVRNGANCALYIDSISASSMSTAAETAVVARREHDVYGTRRSVYSKQPSSPCLQYNNIMHTALCDQTLPRRRSTNQQITIHNMRLFQHISSRVVGLPEIFFFNLHLWFSLWTKSAVNFGMSQ